MTVTFSADAVTSEAMAAETGRLILFDPSIEGSYEWQSPRKLLFHPRAGLRRGTNYTARVSPELKSATGAPLSGPSEFEFKTEPLNLIRAEQAGFTPEKRAVVRLRFSDSIIPAELYKYLSVSSGGQPLKWAVQSDITTDHPNIITDPVTTEALTLKFQPGLAGVSGPLGMRRGGDWVVPLKMRLEVIEVKSYWEKEKANLRLRFSNQLRLEDAKDFISVEPNVPFELVDEYNSVRLVGDFRPETRYTVRVKAGLAADNGHYLMRDVTLSTWVSAIKPFLDMEEVGGHLSTRGSMKMRVRAAGATTLTVTATRVYDNNLVYFAARDSDSYMVSQLGRVAAERSFPAAFEKGKATTTNIDLRELLGPAGAGVYRINVTAHVAEDGAASADGEDDYDDSYRYGNYGNRLQDSGLVSISNLGIVAKQGAHHLQVWTAALDTARPLEGVKVAAYTSKNQLVGETRTDADGIALFRNIPDDDEFQPNVVIARQDDDVCYLNLNDTVNGSEEFSTTGRDYLSRGYEAFMTPERGAYRPGEKVHLVGYLRGRDANLPPDVFPLELRVQRPDHKFWDTRIVTPSASGTIETMLTVPTYAQTGLYRVHVKLPGQAGKKARRAQHSEDYYDEDSGEDSADSSGEEIGTTEFFVEEFVPNRLKIETTASDRRFTTSEPLVLLVKGEEMFGQAAGGRDVSATVTYRPQGFSSEKFPGFFFGDDEFKLDRISRELPDLSLDEQGSATIDIQTPKVRPPAALRAVVQVTVKDVGGRGITSSIERTIDPVPYYIGVRQKAETFPQPGKETAFDVITVLPDDQLHDEDRTLTGAVCRVEYTSMLKREGGSYRFVTGRRLTTIEEFTVTLTGGRGTASYTPRVNGSYLLRIADPESGASTAFGFHVSSGQWAYQPWSMEKPERLELVLDKPLYEIGDTARVIVKSPFPGTLLFTQEQDNVLTTSLFEMTGNTLEIPVPVEAGGVPNFYCVASVMRPVKPEEKWLPHRAFGLVNVPLNSQSRQLAVGFDAPTEIRPNSRLAVPVHLRDTATSDPASGEVTLWAVDEGILTLTGFETPDPVNYFYASRRLGVRTADFYSDLMPDLLGVAQAKSDAGGGDLPGARKRQSPVSAERVKPVALWLGTVPVGADGETTATFDVPQYMGRLRVMATAAAGRKFGKGDATVFVRNPVMVKESLPRFLAPGDRCTVPFVLYNNTDQDREIELIVETSAPLTLASNETSVKLPPVSVKARESVVQHVQFAAGDKCGVARIAYRGISGEDQFGDSLEMAVRPPMPSLFDTTFDTVASGEKKTVQIPGADFLEGTSSGTLVVSGLPTVHLAGGLRFCVDYPYGCAEQTISSVFPLLYLKDLAQQVDPGRFSSDGIAAIVQAGIDRLMFMQTSTGGFSMWTNDRTPWSWASVYGAHFLVEAKKAGYEVSQDNLDAVLNYVSQTMNMRNTANERDWFTERAYACYTLALGGRRKLDGMEALYEKRNILPPSAAALLASAYMTIGGLKEARELLKTAQTADGQASATVVRETGGILSSPARETAILLAAHLDVDPTAAEIPGLAARLQKQARKQGYWGTTQENSFALWALGRYAKFQTANGGTVAGTVALGDRNFEFSTSAPLTLLENVAGSEPLITNEGPGRAYTWARIEGVPRKVDVTSVSQGIGVTRGFTDRSGDDADTAALEQGKMYIVEITLQAERALKNLVIEDLLPAGLEIENANLSSAEHLDYEDTQNALVIRRTEARDDRMVAFVDITRTNEPIVYRYAVRAVTAGTFTLPPVQVGCMYDPDVQARNSAGSVTVAAK